MCLRKFAKCTFRFIPRMRKVSSGHFLYCQMILLADSKGLYQIAHCAVWSVPSLSVYAWRRFFAWNCPYHLQHVRRFSLIAILTNYVTYRYKCNLVRWHVTSGFYFRFCVMQLGTRRLGSPEGYILIYKFLLVNSLDNQHLLSRGIWW